MSPVLFIFLYTLYVLKPTESTGNVFCGSRYQLDNDSVTIYQRSGGKLQVALAERWMGQWRVVAAKRSYAAKTKTYLAVDRLQQILTIKMNNITNGAVVSYKYDGDRFMSGNAKLLTGEPPSIVTYNNTTGTQPRAYGKIGNTQARLVCFKVSGVPYPTLSLYSNSTRVQIQDDVSCLNVTCEANLTLVASNCFGNDTKTVLGGCPISVTSSSSGKLSILSLTNVTTMATSGPPNSTVKATPSVPNATVTTTSSSTVNAASSPLQSTTRATPSSSDTTAATPSSPLQSTTMATPSSSDTSVATPSISESSKDFYTRWQFIVMILIAGTVCITIVVLLMFCTLHRQKKRDLYIVNSTLPSQQTQSSSTYNDREVALYENQHVIDPKLDYVTPYEDTFPYMVTAGNTILAAIKEDAYTWPGESDDGGYLKPLNLASSRKGWESNTSQNSTNAVSETLV